ncbi:glycoside hydrolase family 3 C-terminal domain-containing protein [Schaalia hyovaginalis]|uniref:beta-glucosidase n=1 Tax=Schaalia hyovaginalis TaxID=29316 RepID=UPI002A7EB250|nr:glycoside hydrolase family 3 C-terminal domain-containing protein [Schaalia hyovaginalis]MDY4491802.1 glycoside hydrolase family 3 C-terminal domain-containing protein [Schaalia hyovaginalis]
MTDNPFITCVRAVREGADPQVQAEKLYAELTEDERLGLLDGDTPFWEGLSWMREFAYNHIPYVHGEVARLGIPGTRFVDGPRGCVTGEGTAFPVSMARGATWDTSIEERIGDAIGQEVRAQGGNFFGGVCINLPRHPAWGRSQETYGENSYHLGEFGAALTRGVQRWAIACAKHYALNSMENARFTVDVSVDEASLHEVYLPHFRRVLEEGALAVMSAYNSVNGEWAGQNEYLLTTVLRDMWQWDGITVSDFVWGLRDAAKSLNAGLDIEEPFAQLRARDLKQALEAGETAWEAVRRSGVRIIATLLKSYAERIDEEVGPEVMASATHRALAREAAARSMVLLKNEPVDGAPVLPLSAEVERIALIGRLATAPNMGDSGSSLVHPPSHVTPFDGLTEAYPNAVIELIEEDDPKAAAEAAARADVAIIVAGFDLRDEGEYVGEDTMANPELTALFPEAPADAVDPGEAQEAVIMTGGGAYGGDRVSLSLRPIDEEIISAVRAANPRTIVSIVAGGAVIVDPWIDSVPAALMMWYAGMEGGRALADVLTGRQNPSGRLPFAVPTSLDPLPFFDRNAVEITYDRYHGQRLFDKEGAEVRFPLGFGLSYTSYAITSVEASLNAKGAGRVAATVTNRGDRDGVHVVQVYAVPGEAMPFAGERFLVGFAPVAVAAGGTSEIEIPVSLRPISHWNPDSKNLEFTSGEVTLLVGANAHDEDALSAVLPIEGGVA